jgi:hypothetical protein
VPPEAVAAELGGMATPYGVEVALSILARTVAERLRRGS